MGVPPAQDHQPRAGIDGVERAVDVPQDDKVEVLGEPAGVLPVLPQPLAIERLLILQVRPLELGPKGVGERRGDPSKRGQERPALEDRLPGRLSPQPVPVRQVSPEPLDLDVQVVRQEPGSQRPFVKRPEPGVVIARQNRDRSPRSRNSARARSPAQRIGSACHWRAAYQKSQRSPTTVSESPGPRQSTMAASRRARPG